MSTAPVAGVSRPIVSPEVVNHTVPSGAAARVRAATAPSGKKVMLTVGFTGAPVIVSRPIPPETSNHSSPVLLLMMPSGPWIAGSVKVVTAPRGVMRPISPAAPFVNQRFASVLPVTLVMLVGSLMPGSVNVVTSPAGVMRPIA